MLDTFFTLLRAASRLFTTPSKNSPDRSDPETDPDTFDTDTDTSLLIPPFFPPSSNSDANLLSRLLPDSTKAESKSFISCSKADSLMCGVLARLSKGVVGALLRGGEMRRDEGSGSVSVGVCSLRTESILLRNGDADLGVGWAPMLLLLRS